MSRHLDAPVLWTLDRLGAVALAPHGRQAVVTVTRHDLARNRGQTALWRLDSAGRGAPRRLTTAPGRLAQPAWDPAGTRIAFLGTRDQDGISDERPQLYLIDADGGEARRASDFAPGLEAFRWLPDGRGVLFSAWVWPELRGARAQAARHKAFKARQASGYATSEAQFRQWDHHHPMDRVLHLMHLDLASSRVTDLFEGSGWQLPREDATPEPFDASPDGRWAAFAYDPAPEKRNGNRLALARIELATRRVQVLADDAGWSFEQPRWSPDGSRIAVLAAETGRVHTAPLRPALVDAGAAAPRHGRRWQPLGQRWDHEASSPPRWAPDGASLLLSAESRGRCLLWRCTPDGGDGRFEPLTDSGWVQGFDVAGRGDDERLLLLRDAHAHPPRVYLQRAGAAPRRLERFNDRVLGRLALGLGEEVELRGALGDPVQMWLTYPPGFDARRRHPLLQVIHGGPFAAAGDTWSWRWNVHVLASQGHVVAQVNYHGSSGFGHAFKHAIMGRLAQLEHEDIEAATDWLCAKAWADPRRVYAAGGSYGGFLCGWINGHAKPGRWRAHVCHAGVWDRVATFAADSWATRRHDLGAWYWEDMARVLAQSPHAHAAGLCVPTLVVHGALDYRVPDANGLAYFHTLKARGIDARLLWFPDENHWVLKPANSLQWHEELFAWLARHGGARAQALSSADGAQLGVGGLHPRRLRRRAAAPGPG
ncbi:MAG: S9 family peptidase [Rubrivivax sp.]